MLLRGLTASPADAGWDSCDEEEESEQNVHERNLTHPCPPPKKAHHTTAHNFDANSVVSMWPLPIACRKHPILTWTAA